MWVRFIDMFAGVGGFRLGMERAGHECVWSCEIDKFCQAVYRHHWGRVEAGDARRVDPATIPDFDVLCAGFPCQSFSVAGKRKGFQDTRGTLFYEISRIAGAKRPRLLLLENVRGLLSNDRGQTFLTVLRELGRIGYWAEWQVLNSKNHGVPQNRPRVFLVGHLGEGGGREVFPVIGGGGEPDEVAGETEERGQGVGCQTALALRGGDKWQQVVATSLSANDRKQRRGGGTLIVEDFYRGRPARTYEENAPSLRSGRHGLKVVEAPFMIHNVYGGFKEEEPRVFKDHSPAIRTPKGGGHLPHVVEPMIYRHPLNYGKKSVYSPSEVHPSLRTVSRPPRVLNATNPHSKSEDRRYHPSDEARALKGPSGNQESLVALIQSGQVRLRRPTPREAERLQGFPDDWTRWGLNENGEKIEISDTQRYRMMGNAVTVNVVEFLARRLPT